MTAIASLYLKDIQNTYNEQSSKPVETSRNMWQEGR